MGLWSCLALMSVVETIKKEKEMLRLANFNPDTL